MNIFDQVTEPKMKYVGNGLCKGDYGRYTETFVVLGITRKTDEETIEGYVIGKHKYIITLLNLRSYTTIEVEATSYVERTEPTGVTNIIDIEFI